MWRTILALFCTFSLFGATNAVRSVRLRWIPNTNTVASGFIVYWGTISSNYTHSTNVGYVTNALIAAFTPGSNYVFAVTSYDYDGIESDFSNERSWQAPPKPQPPFVDLDIPKQ